MVVSELDGKGGLYYALGLLSSGHLPESRNNSMRRLLFLFARRGLAPTKQRNRYENYESGRLLAALEPELLPTIAERCQKTRKV